MNAHIFIYLFIHVCMSVCLFTNVCFTCSVCVMKSERGLRVRVYFAFLTLASFSLSHSSLSLCMCVCVTLIKVLVNISLFFIFKYHTDNNFYARHLSFSFSCLTHNKFNKYCKMLNALFFLLSFAKTRN